MTEYLYFFINYPRDKEEIPKKYIYWKKSIKLECIFTEYEYENKNLFTKRFLNSNHLKEKYKIEFVNGQDRYIISFPR